jgi:threonyl-tRNA synthetase
MIHRAILGSVERMIAILTESYGGKWFIIMILCAIPSHIRPFWLSPRQARIIPIVPKYDDYAFKACVCVINRCIIL